MIRKINATLILLIAAIILFSGISYAEVVITQLFSGISGGGAAEDDEPHYYSLEDLRSGLTQSKFYFNNVNKPTEALVNLGYFPPYAACANNKKFVVSRISLNPSKFGISTFKIASSWNDNREIAFDWYGFKNLAKEEPCILIFTRGNGLGAEIVKRFSNWSHVAITDDSYDALVFESTPDTGVQVNNAKKTWKNLTYYTCRRINPNYDPQRPILFGNLQYALKKAEITYSGKPYYPKVETCFDLFGAFLYKWSDKNNMDSMYCSKLVYHTFKGYIDFDTKRTMVCSSIIGDRNCPVGAGFFDWIGISPDDIYYSNTLDRDFFYSNNVKYL